MSDYTKARGVHSIVTPSERADPLHGKNRSRLISKLARLNHQKLLLERLNRVWIEQLTPATATGPDRFHP